MGEAPALLQQDTWRVIDQSGLGPYFHALQSFAIDDTLCLSVGSKHSPAVLRSWVHPETIVLGIQDTKLPGLEQGLDYLKKAGRNWIVRNSGGLAVALDEGVLNLTLVFPDTERGIDIDRGYTAMWELVKMMFRDFNCEIEAREIVGSYCPGSFDLSIEGKKFAGISQRRIRKGVAVQVYLCVTGSGEERAAFVRDFYEHAKFREPSKFTYPDIRPEVMASLTELLSPDMTVQNVMLRCLETLKSVSSRIYADGLDDQELEWYEGFYERMIDRNKKFL